MKFGIGLPQRECADLGRDVVVEVAVGAEQAGFDSLWAAYEPPAVPADAGEASWGRAFAQAARPLSVLAAAAAATTRIRLGTSVPAAPLHDPISLAKSLTTIDLLGGGARVVAGLGSGWPTDDLAVAGASLADRRQCLDETIDVLRAAWGADPVSHDGRLACLTEAPVQPKPLGPIPIMLGGAARAGLQRIAADLAGWLPVDVPPDEVRATVSFLRARMWEHCRDSERLEVIYRANLIITDEPAGSSRRRFTGTQKQIVGDAVVLAEAGVTEFILEFQFGAGCVEPKQLVARALDIRDDITARLGPDSAGAEAPVG